MRSYASSLKGLCTMTSNRAVEENAHNEQRRIRAAALLDLLCNARRHRAQRAVLQPLTCMVHAHHPQLAFPRIRIYLSGSYHSFALNVSTVLFLQWVACLASLLARSHFPTLAAQALPRRAGTSQIPGLGCPIQLNCVHIPRTNRNARAHPFL